MLRKLATAIAPSLSPSEIANVQDRSSRVRAALGKLSPQQQQVLEMRELRGLSYEAIGEKLGIGPTAARQTRVRALRSLAQILKQDDTR